MGKILYTFFHYNSLLIHYGCEIAIQKGERNLIYIETYKQNHVPAVCVTDKANDFD